MSLKWTITIYLTWMTLHYAAAHAYIHLCVPFTLKGVLLSPFIVPTFHCTTLRWMVYTGGNKMITMWFMAAAYVLGKLNQKIEHEVDVD
jgi:hypothetical protein